MHDVFSHFLVIDGPNLIFTPDIVEETLEVQITSLDILKCLLNILNVHLSKYKNHINANSAAFLCFFSVVLSAASIIAATCSIEEEFDPEGESAGIGIEPKDALSLANEANLIILAVKEMMENNKILLESNLPIIIPATGDEKMMTITLEELGSVIYSAISASKAALSAVDAIQHRYPNKAALSLTFAIGTINTSVASILTFFAPGSKLAFLSLGSALGTFSSTEEVASLQEYKDLLDMCSTNSIAISSVFAIERLTHKLLLLCNKPTEGIQSKQLYKDNIKKLRISKKKKIIAESDGLVAEFCETMQKYKNSLVRGVYISLLLHVAKEFLTANHNTFNDIYKSMTPKDSIRLLVKNFQSMDGQDLLQNIMANSMSISFIVKSSVGEEAESGANIKDINLNDIVLNMGETSTSVETSTLEDTDGAKNSRTRIGIFQRILKMLNVFGRGIKKKAMKIGSFFRKVFQFFRRLWLSFRRA